MKQVWTTEQGELQLLRYPPNQHDKSLQAWDSADEYLVEYALQHKHAMQSPLLINDQFGAISLALQTLEPSVATDSKITRLAIERNAALNGLTIPTVLGSLANVPNVSVALLKLPKNHDYLAYWLAKLAAMPNLDQIVATGKTQQVTSAVLTLFEQYFDDVKTTLAQKKSRLIIAKQPRETLPDTPIFEGFDWQGLSVQGLPNVFCRDKPDIGGRFLAENLPELDSGDRIIDLGCGNGLLGISCLRQAKQMNKGIQVTFCDESEMAVASSQHNVEQNLPEFLNACQFIQDDCLSQQAADSADIILCNPPFHQNNTITEHIALQMFHDAKRVLVKGGSLYVVANRHLNYPDKLKKIFGGFKVHNQNPKFNIYRSVK